MRVSDERLESMVGVCQLPRQRGHEPDNITYRGDVARALVLDLRDARASLAAALREREQAIAAAREQGAAEYAASMDAERAGWQQRIAAAREALDVLRELYVATLAHAEVPHTAADTIRWSRALSRAEAAIRAHGKEAGDA